MGTDLGWLVAWVTAAAVTVMGRKEFGRFCQQFGEFLAIGYAEVANERLCFLDCASVKRVGYLTAALGEPYAYGASVVGIREALHEATRLERVHELANGRWFDRKPGGQVADAEPRLRRFVR